ncbi:MAG: ABC transporter ATP-binding protein [Armatimonadetes bacterium]|nr:ABC transporter ATP-binding protein [Armatimonadota bacterium]
MASDSFSVTDFSVGYDRQSVLSGFNCEIQPGQSVALLGPNGSGKSSILKSLIGNLPPIQGIARYKSEDLIRMSSTQRAKYLSFVPQGEPPIFGFSVIEAVLMGRHAALAGAVETDEDIQKARAALEQVDALHLGDRVITELSGGEYQRVLLARAIAQEAPVLLLDEPTAHLDLRHQLELTGIFNDLRKAGKMLLCAIHDLNIALQFCDQCICLSDKVAGEQKPIREAINSGEVGRCLGVNFEWLQGSRRDWVTPV